ncbi:MAG: PDZ domain-containing protein [Desulfobacteraceae bacterium]|nr:MAG: PDZ domain-containing protein [Desulfobacteraceae bacterium]
MTKLFYTILNIVAVSLVVYIGVDTFYRVVSSELKGVNTKEIVMEQLPNAEESKRSPLSSFQVITERNLFGSLDKASEDVNKEEIEDLELTSLKIALLGTVTGSEQNAFAVIEETDKRKQGLYKIGDSVQNATVKKILREKVVLRVGTKDEILTMEESAASRRDKGRRPSKSTERGTTITVSRKDIQSSLKDINKLMSQVRIRPHFKDGKSDGLSISRIKGGSIFSKLGLRNGDIVQKINGEPINSPDEVLVLYEKLKSGSRVSLEVTRKGEPKTMNYRFR